MKTASKRRNNGLGVKCRLDDAKLEDSKPDAPDATKMCLVQRIRRKQKDRTKIKHIYQPLPKGMCGSIGLLHPLGDIVLVVGMDDLLFAALHLHLLAHEVLQLPQHV